MAHLLIADDEARIRALIRKYAEFEGHDVVEAEDGEQAVKLALSTPFDLIVMDVMMPKLDGFSAGVSIREHTDTPILILSARGEEYDRVNGFQIGADDYVVKPFSPKELMLRIDAILKRVGEGRKDKHDCFTYRTLTVDFSARLVYIRGERIEMTPREYELLVYLCRNRNRALTREQLITSVWGYDYYGDDRTLDTHIKLLRRSLREFSSLIVTLRGVGYRFETE